MTSPITSPIASPIDSPIASRTRSKRMKMDDGPNEYINTIKTVILNHVNTLADVNYNKNVRAKTIFAIYDIIINVEKDDPVKNDVLFKTSKFFIVFYTKLFELESQLLEIKLNCMTRNKECDVDFNTHIDTIDTLKQVVEDIGKKRGFMINV